MIRPCNVFRNFTRSNFVISFNSHLKEFYPNIHAMENLQEKVEAALDSIRDYLRSDGGDVRIHNIREDMVLELELLGNCENCSMSAMTMKAGIEEVVKRMVPEIVRVEAIKKDFFY